MNPVLEFLAVKEKTANWLGDMGRAIKSGLGGGAVGHYLAPAVASAGVAAAGLGIKAGYELVREKLTRQRDYKAMVDANPSLRGMDAKQVNMVYNSLRRLSPTMARDPLVAGSFVRKTIELAPESGLSIDPLTAKTIAETQKNIAQAKSSKTSVYEAMLSGLGKQMPGLEASYGPGGPTFKGIGAERAARKAGLPMGGRSELSLTLGGKGPSISGPPGEVMAAAPGLGIPTAGEMREPTFFESRRAAHEAKTSPVPGKSYKGRTAGGGFIDMFKVHKK